MATPRRFDSHGTPRPLEQALSVPGDPPPGLVRTRASGAAPDLADLGYTRLYVGDEDREDGLPAPGRLARLRAACHARGVAVTLVTPAGLGARTGRIREPLAAMRPGDEVVVNDPRVLDDVLRAGCLPVLGRRLAGGAGTGSSDVADLPERRGFMRVDLPDAAPGPARAPAGALPTSLYLPSYPIAPGSGGPAAVPLGCALPPDLAALRTDRLVRPVRPGEWSWLAGRNLRRGWNAVYARRLRDVGPTPFVEPFEPALLAALAGAIDSVFDLGCGIGTHLLAFSALGRKAGGIDVSRVAIEAARRRLPTADLHHGDLLDAPLSGAFDLVLDLGTFHAIHPCLRDAFVRRALSLLSAPGMLLAFCFARDDRLLPCEPVVLLGGRVPEWGFSRGEIDALFGPSLVRAWSRDLPGDPQTPPKHLVLFARPGEGEARARDVVRAMADRAKAPKDPPPVPPEGLPLDVAAWLDPRDARALRDLGVGGVEATEFPSGRLVLRLSIGDRAVRLDLAPASQDAPHYRTVGRYHVGYWAPGVEMSVVDGGIEALARTLSRAPSRRPA